MGIIHIHIGEGIFPFFIEHFLLPNQPCMFDEQFTATWKSRELWHNNGKPNFVYLKDNFGNSDVPIANCNRNEYSSHPKTTWKLYDFLEYWSNLQDTCQPVSHDQVTTFHGLELLYMKDWHFSRDFPDYGAYDVIESFKIDWLNEVWDQSSNSGEVQQDDYRFVYMGPKGTWTPFHADVFRSYSWSTNVCGQKEWLLYPPGEEEHLRDRHGYLPFDVTSPDLIDSDKYPNTDKVKGLIKVIQNEGETIFVPSGWYHQVHNLEDTISINHNWTNGFGIDYMWTHMKLELHLVEREISDCQDMEGWNDQCQLILKVNTGMNFADFFQFLSVIVMPRIQQLKQLIECDKVSQLKDISELQDSLISSVINQTHDGIQDDRIYAGNPVMVEKHNTCSVYQTTDSSLKSLIACLSSDVQKILITFNKWTIWNNSIKFIVTLRVYEVIKVCDIIECNNNSQNSFRTSLFELFK